VQEEGGPHMTALRASVDSSASFAAASSGVSFLTGAPSTSSCTPLDVVTPVLVILTPSAGESSGRVARDPICASSSLPACIRPTTCAPQPGAQPQQVSG
jgi:hypothetical protein